MLSEKVKYISVAQLVHEILIKTVQVEFSNFHNFVSFFFVIFSSKVSVPKLLIYGVLPQNHIKKWLSVKNVLKLAIFDKKKSRRKNLRNCENWKIKS